MAALFLPEFLELFAICDIEGEVVLLDLESGSAKLVKNVTLDSELTEGDLSTVLVHSGVDELELGVFLLNDFFNLFPVNLEIFLRVNLSIVRDNDWIFVVLVDHDDLAILIEIIFLLRLSLLVSRLLVAFLIANSVGYLFGKFLVISASDGISLNFDVSAIFAGCLNIFLGPASDLHLLAVQEVTD